MPRRQQTGSGRTIGVGWSEDSSGDEKSPGDPPPPPPPASAASRRRRPLLLIGAVAALLALVLVLPPVLLGGVPAEEVAERYLEAVVAGDAETVREHLAPQDDVLDIALTDAVLAATGDPIERFSIDRVSIDGDSAEITVTLARGEVVLETTLHLARHREGLLRPPVWQLQPVRLPVLEVEIPVGSEALRINGQLLEIPVAHRPREAFGLSGIRLHVLPGTVELQAQEIGDHVTPLTVQVEVPPVLGDWTSRFVDAGFELTEQGMEELSGQLVDSLETCARSTSPHPEGCPFAAPSGVSGPGSWELTRVPDVHVAEQEHGLIHLMVFADAEFTVPPGASGAPPQTHRVALEAEAMAMLDRRGRFHTDWFGPEPADSTPGE